MAAILPCIKIDSDAHLAKHFMVHQLHWILAEDAIHARGRQAFALAEKSVRIGWTYADGFKNARKRLRFKKRNYLFVTKDWPSSLEYMTQVYEPGPRHLVALVVACRARAERKRVLEPRRDQPWAMVVYDTEEEQNRAPIRPSNGQDPVPDPAALI